MGEARPVWLQALKLADGDVRLADDAIETAEATGLSVEDVFSIVRRVASDIPPDAAEALIAKHDTADGRESGE